MKIKNMANQNVSIRQGLLRKEQKIFDEQIKDRIKHGFVPDLRSLRKVNWLYNNVWRDPEYVKIHWLPKVNFVLNAAKKGAGKVLEVGCGCGYLSLELARNGLDVVGVDISEKSITIAKKYHSLNKFRKGFGKLSYRCCDIASFNRGKEEFNSVVFFRSLHHMDDINKVLYNAHSLLKRNGNLIICEPVRGNFTRKSAEFAALLRAILPTWEPYKKKITGLCSLEAWNDYVQRIYDEYTYKGEFEQSPMDNLTDSSKFILKAVRKRFKIKTIKFSDAFIDKLIGGLRGKDRYALARFLKFLDNYMVKHRMLAPTEITIHAKK